MTPEIDIKQIKKLQNEYHNLIFLAEGINYEHQQNLKFEILYKAENIKENIKDLKKDSK